MDPIYSVQEIVYHYKKKMCFH